MNCSMCNKKSTKSDGAMFFCKKCGEKVLANVYEKGAEDALDKLNAVFRTLGEDAVMKILRRNLWNKSIGPSVGPNEEDDKNEDN